VDQATVLVAISYFVYDIGRYIMATIILWLGISFEDDEEDNEEDNVSTWINLSWILVTVTVISLVFCFLVKRIFYPIILWMDSK
jgi:hypothetical protein